MDAMRIIKFSLLFALFVFGLWGAFIVGRTYSAAKPTEAEILKAQIGEFSGDGRFGTRCALSGAGECSVPFARLVAFPERYHGKEISVFGYLTDFPGGNIFELSQTQDSAQIPVSFKNFEITCHMPDGLRAKAKDGVWVVVSGKFDARTLEADSLGSICASAVNEPGTSFHSTDPH